MTWYNLFLHLRPGANLSSHLKHGPCSLLLVTSTCVNCFNGASFLPIVNNKTNLFEAEALLSPHFIPKLLLMAIPLVGSGWVLLQLGLSRLHQLLDAIFLTFSLVPSRLRFLSSICWAKPFTSFKEPSCNSLNSTLISSRNPILNAP